MAGESENLREFGPWSEQTSSSGRKYFYNSETEVSQWDKPKEWREHEQRLEAERLAAEQHRMQPVPPPPPLPFFGNFPYNSVNVPPQPNYQGYQGGRIGTAPPTGYNSFLPPTSIPPVPPPPRNTLPRHPDIGGSIYPIPQYRNYFPPPMPPAPKYNTPPVGAPISRGPSSSSVNRNYGRPSPSQQVPQSRYTPQHDNRAQSQPDVARSHSRDEQGKPHPYATPQPIMNQNQPYQQTPKRPTRDSRDGYDSEQRPAKQYKREYEAGSSTDESPVNKRPAIQQQQQPDDDNMDISVGKDEEEEQGQTGQEEWRPYYRPDLSQKKASELGLEDDTELGDIQMQCIVLENKWQNAEIQAKQSAATRMVVEQEVKMTQMRIDSCRQQQRDIEARTMQQVPVSGEKRKEYLENLLRRLRAMKSEIRAST